MRLLIPALLVTLLPACGGPDVGPEEALRAWVAQAESAAEEKDRSGLMDMISESYVDARGNDHGDVDQILRLWFLRQQSIALISKIDEITVNGGTAANVVVTVGMAGTDQSALGLRADAHRFDLELEHSGDEWMLIGARWGELGGGMH